MAGTFVMVAILGERDDDRKTVISLLEQRFGVTALPDHMAAMRSNPSPAHLALLLEQQVRDRESKKQKLGNAPYRILLQPCSPLQLVDFAEREGGSTYEPSIKSLLDKDTSDELIVIASDPCGEKEGTLLKRAEAHRPGHVFVTSDPEDESILGEVEASLAQIGGWGVGY